MVDGGERDIQSKRVRGPRLLHVARATGHTYLEQEALHSYTVLRRALRPHLPLKTRGRLLEPLRGMGRHGANQNTL